MSDSYPWFARGPVLAFVRATFKAQKDRKKMYNDQPFKHRESNSGLPSTSLVGSRHGGGGGGGCIPYAMSDLLSAFVGWTYRPVLNLGSSLIGSERIQIPWVGNPLGRDRDDRVGEGPNERDLGSGSKNVSMSHWQIGHRESNSGLSSTSFEGSRHKEKGCVPRHVRFLGRLVGWLYGIAEFKVGSAAGMREKFARGRGDLHRIN
ncbi:hypothetical protein B0H14DRAFT_2644468 [Mycena olivaceomarginata]|nr:hypothetical protein B0H14DRAFT_2644468 [Mycena olivaceomarginata]